MGVTNPLLPRGPYMQEKPLLLDGTSQEIVPQLEAAFWFRLQNPVGNGDVTVNVTGGDATASGFIVAGGESFELPIGTQQSITVAGTNGESVYSVAGY